MLFKEKKRLLELYNALNDTTYSDEDELTVKTLNINYGHNKELLEKCPTLNEYAQFVSMLRTNLKYMNLSEAMEKTIEECISQDILRDFLMEQKSEVVAMSIYEYNEEYVMRVTYEEGEIAGYKRGKADGHEQNLIHNIEAAMKNLGISLEKACEVLEISMEEYQQAKAGNSQAG